MNQPFAVTNDGKVVMYGVKIQDGQCLVSADRFVIKLDAIMTESSKADQLEHRLLKVEQALGLNPIYGH
jgi:predicted aconitase